MYIKFPSGNISTAEVPPTTHNAGTQTLMQATTMIKDEKEDCQQVVFLSDTHSILKALEGDKLPHLMEDIQEPEKER